MQSVYQEDSQLASSNEVIGPALPMINVSDGNVIRVKANFEWYGTSGHDTMEGIQFQIKPVDTSKATALTGGEGEVYAAWNGQMVTKIALFKATLPSTIPVENVAFEVYVTGGNDPYGYVQYFWLSGAVVNTTLLR